jgi:hypothetical protein
VSEVTSTGGLALAKNASAKINKIAEKLGQELLNNKSDNQNQSAAGSNSKSSVQLKPRTSFNLGQLDKTSSATSSCEEKGHLTQSSDTLGSKDSSQSFKLTSKDKPVPTELNNKLSMVSEILCLFKKNI